MAIHFKQRSKVGEKAIAEAGFSLGDGHSTSVEYERKTLVNGAVFWFAVAIFRLMPAAQSCCSEKLLWAPEDLTKGASSEDPKIPVLEYRDGGEAYGSRRSATFRNRSMQRRLGPLPHPVSGTHAQAAPTYRGCERVSEIYMYLSLIHI